MKVKLITPEIIYNKEVIELEFRGHLGADLEEIIREFSSGGKALTELTSKLIISHPLSVDDFRKFKAKNYMVVVNKMMNFLS